MAKSLIHIGYPRTGSSWLQNSVFPYIQNYSFLTRKDVQQHLIRPTSFSGHADSFPEINSQQAIILSEEMISGRFHGGHVNFLLLKEYLKRIKAIIEKFEIILFIRRQQNIIYSLYNLYIRKGGTYSLKRFLDQSIEYKNSFLFGKEYLCYDQLFSYLTEEKHTVHIFLYEDLLEDPQTFLARFCDRLSIEISDKGINTDRINAGYPVSILKLKRIVNHLSKRGIPFKENIVHLPFCYNFLVPFYKKKDPGISTRHRKTLNDFCAFYKSSNSNFQKLSGISDLEKYDYPLL
jgi:hypothetical protein